MERQKKNFIHRSKLETGKEEARFVSTCKEKPEVHYKSIGLLTGTSQIQIFALLVIVMIAGKWNLSLQKLIIKYKKMLPKKVCLIFF